MRTISNDLHMDYSAVGQTTHLAARIDRLPPEEPSSRPRRPLAPKYPCLTAGHRGTARSGVAPRLAHLQAAEFLYETRLFPEQVCTYQQALTLADELGMRPLQAHCHLGLGTLYAKVEQEEQARAELSTAIALYRTMEMTFWLPQAEAALAQVETR